MFRYILKKEFLLIFRDIHALLVLFVMPAVFILIMSLALKNTYSDSFDVKLKVAIIAKENLDIKTFIKELNNSSYFTAYLTSDESIKTLIYDKKYDFIVKLDSDFKNKINSNEENFQIQSFSKADINKEHFHILKNSIVEIISKTIMKDYFIKSKIDAKVLSELNNKINNSYIYKNDKIETKANSVQQSVPSWLVFSMFFILIPISNTFINEKNFGTISRIRSINVSLFPILASKIIPYFIINQIQVIIMILIGIYIIPIFGGDSLVINGNYLLIFCMSSAISIAAICFALFIANISKTTEEATSIGGVINIIFAALGGIMVPKFVMPEFMQNITSYSPMSWGLEGLLEIFVRGGNFNDIKIYLLYLLLFATISILLAYILLKKGRN
ncbi:ABC transporter permease [Arcobacter aquimarinus]|uniref:ABC transporter, permease protein n=1 Tax=Arcobacter aquimarinus TaxID=1315211 RepID=A0AAE7B2S0_9BACT|nr:ABC transporter permease [Arcobacter aquimarinus]QKE24975.1 ABC transporter, permease protein [Arcobacter aquimarinus]RXI36783.1 ABC transporter [Arcobacter aquimarinus]